MRYHVELRAVRAYYGFSQPALAPWLGLSRVLRASIETGREALPAHARPWLRPWLAALSQAEPEVAPAADHPLASALVLTGPAPVLARLAECDYQYQRLGQQQAALLAGHRVAARRLVAGPLLQAALPAVTAVPELTALALRRRWLARLLEAAADALAPEAPTGPVAALLLEARRHAYRQETDWLHTWLAGPG